MYDDDHSDEPDTHEVVIDADGNALIDPLHEDQSDGNRHSTDEDADDDEDHGRLRATAENDLITAVVNAIQDQQAAESDDHENLDDTQHDDEDEEDDDDEAEHTSGYNSVPTENQL
jgi:hypothetical protein